MSGGIHNAASPDCDWDVSEMRRLLDEGVDVNATDYEGSTALHRAIRREKWHTVQLLLDRGAHINRVDKKQRTPLHLSVKLNNLQLSSTLLQRNAEVDKKNFKLKTPLLMAAKRGNVKISELLLNANADVNSADHFKQTPLHFASKNGRELVETLLRAGANVRAGDRNKRTPLHLAVEVEYDNLAVVLSLLLAGAPLDAQDTDGKTPLHLASDLGVIECLLAFGARTDVRDNSGGTPFDKLIRDENMTKLMIKIATVNFHNKQCDIDFSYLSIMDILGELLPELKTYRDDCLREVEKMKQDKIGCFSLFSVISDSPDPKFASRQSDFDMRINQVENEGEYPNVVSLLKLRFLMGVRKRELLNEVDEIWPSLIQNRRYCSIGRYIFMHLSIADLTILKHVEQ